MLEQQQCVAFLLCHTIFHKPGFSQIDVTTRRRSTSSTGASRELRAKESGLSRAAFRRRATTWQHGFNVSAEPAREMASRADGYLPSNSWRRNG
jgi:hypothetical protein